MKKLPILGATLLALMLLAGCGSSKSSSTATTAAAPASSTSTEAATTSATTAAAGPGEMVLTKHSKLGTVLAAGPKKLTVYVFEADRGGRSTCSGTCAQVWPPVTTAAEAQASGAAVSADLSTITRSDGTKQVTYKGHPLYFYAKDKDDGDAYGQGSKSFGAGWYVLTPSGKKIDDDEGDDGDSGS